MSSLIIATIITLFQSILTCPSSLPLELRSSIFPPASGVPGGGGGAEAPSIYIGGGLPIKPPVLLIILPNPSPRWTQPLFRAPIWFPKTCGSGYLSGPIFLPWLATLRTVLLGMLRILFSQFTWAEWCVKHVNPIPCIYLDLAATYVQIKELAPGIAKSLDATAFSISCYHVLAQRYTWC